MKRERIYVVSIVVLILLNGWLLFCLLRAEHAPHQKPPKLTSWLNFEGDLRSKIDALERNHFERKDKLMEQNFRLHNDLVELVVSDQVNDSLLQQKLLEIGQLQQDIERMTAYYFKEIYSFCSADQRQKFKHEIKRVLNRMGAPPKRH